MKRLIGSATAIATLMAIGQPTVAQVAEVPKPTKQGDFRTAKVMGNRGYYANTSWLVVDQTPLNCRVSPNGKVQSTLMPGAVIKAVFTGQNKEAIVLQQGSPWLRVAPKAPNMMSGQPGTCYVRANLRYVAPISEDYIRSGGVQS